ncbi:PAS and helix-turn-helix domain-containing protein [Desulfogranum japonicum]|uniref:PAS and helix-turn-helix domain-containing protein n=1 Tax=Desulfogranum japonicum TaxID=231447 RepID=UPI0003FDFC4A|nr:PAS and helix-turn-helix domain-containing protein [Desulfogranum japonicum]
MEDQRKNHNLRQYIKDLEFNNLILTAQQEVSLDAILVVNENWQMVSFNQRFVEMWDIPHHILENRDDKASLATVLDKLRNPEQFLARVEALMANPTEQSHDELALIDGRIFDRYSAPIFDKKNDLRGRVWFFRDVTELHRAKQLLHQQNSELEERVAKRTDDLERLNQELRERDRELQLQQKELEAKNLGLTTLLHSVEKEKNRLEQQTISNFSGALLPILEMLADTSLSRQQRHILDTIETVLANLTSSMNHNLRLMQHPLTATEMKVANAIRAGKTSKEIAVLLRSSERTVEGHRQSIRRKLGMDKKQNLMVTLMALE